MGSGLPGLVRAAQVPVSPGVVENGEVRHPEAVGEALRELWKRGGFKSRQVTVGVGNQRVVVRELTVPALADKELRQSLPFQVQDLIPIPVEEAILDFDVLEELEDEGRRALRLLVVAAQRTMVHAVLDAVSRARLDPVGVDLVPFALVRSAAESGGLGLDEDEAGDEAVVDVGGDVTNICVHERGVPRFVRILPSGGRDITTSISGALGISEDDAEALKRGTTPQDRRPPIDARRVLDERMAAIVDEIRSSLDFFRAQTPGAEVSRVLVTGGGSKLPGLVALLDERLDAQVERGRAFSKLQVRLDMDEVTLAEAEPLLAVSLGLALPQG